MKRFRRSGSVFLLACGAALCALGVTGGAQAHPHVWVDARGEVLFSGGTLVGMRHHWTFDEYFSAWAVQGMDADGDGELTASELQPLAEENMVGLDYYSYYTFAGRPGGDNLGFEGVADPSMVFEDGRTTLSFTVLFEEGISAGGVTEIEVGDPDFYSAITFAGTDAVTLENAPEGCSVESHAPQPIDPALEEQLFMLGPDVTELPPELEEAARSQTNLAVVQCPEGVAATALDATAQVGSARPQPFAAPPVEPNLFGGGAQTGFLGWIAAQQRSFYTALTEALSALQEDWTAFWVLGGLSFLYGVFHAAGPGHGKIVISSYVVANERQVRRGIALSFASAMMQAVVAVAFILVAAGFLRMTSIAMSGAAQTITLVSYGLVAVLGAYLAARKILGFSHAHAHDDLAPLEAAGHAGHGHAPAHDHHAHDHHGEEDGHHCHAVMPAEAPSDWKGALGVVLAVGLRPCSGALVVLVFALTQDLLAAGIFATFLMALGTALTVALLAALAVTFKGMALRLAGSGGGTLAARGVWWLELLAALVVMAFGLMLLFASI